MSYSTVYDVTLALRTLLHSQLVRVIDTAIVTVLPPGDDLPAQPGVNLYLYRVTESPSTKNRPWPGDRSTRPSGQPALGLELSYLLTPLAKPSDAAAFSKGDDAHTMLGAAMLTLQTNPVLNNVHIPALGGVANSGFDSDLVLSQALIDSYEQVKVSLLPTDIDEISKIWAAINKPYRLSVAYEVSLVELTPRTPPLLNGGIVTYTNVEILQLQPPNVTALTPALGAVARAGGTLANTITISGFGFSSPGQTPVVRIGGQVAAVDTGSATDQKLIATLPNRLDGGPNVDVRVTINGQPSLPATFTVSPWLARISPVRIPLDTGAPPTLHLTGSGFTTSPLNVGFARGGIVITAPPLAGGNDTQAAALVLSALANGLYDISLVLNDGAHSATNLRQLEIVPLLSTVDVGSAVVDSKTVSKLTLKGQRLNGNDVRLTLDGVTYLTGSNSTANQLVYTLGRVLDPGPHTVAVNVDGHASHTVPFNA